MPLVEMIRAALISVGLFAGYRVVITLACSSKRFPPARIGGRNHLNASSAPQPYTRPSVTEARQAQFYTHSNRYGPSHQPINTGKMASYTKNLGPYRSPRTQKAGRRYVATGRSNLSVALLQWSIVESHLNRGSSLSVLCLFGIAFGAAHRAFEAVSRSCRPDLA